MATLQEILARAQALREETALGSISPERAGSIMYDTLQQINQMQLEGARLVISKIYESVAAMQADTAPVSDLTGKDLRPGQLVVIVPSDTSSSDLGSVYRYNGMTEGASSWSFTGKIGGYPMDQTPTQGSTRAVTSGGVYEQITELGQDFDLLAGEFIEKTTYDSATISALARRNYYIVGDTGQYNTSTSYKHSLLPVTPGHRIKVYAATGAATGIAFLKSDAAPVSGGTPDYAEGWTTRVSVVAGETMTFIVPNDAAYMYMYRGTSANSYSGTPRLIEDFSVGVPDGSINEAMFEEGAVDAAISGAEQKYYSYNLLNSAKSSLGYIDKRDGLLFRLTSGSIYATDFIPVSKNGIYAYCATTYGSYGGTAVYDSDKNFLRATAAAKTYTYQEGDAYVRFTYNNTNGYQLIIECYPDGTYPTISGTFEHPYKEQVIVPFNGTQVFGKENVSSLIPAFSLAGQDGIVNKSDTLAAGAILRTNGYPVYIKGRANVSARCKFSTFSPIYVGTGAGLSNGIAVYVTGTSIQLRRFTGTDYNTTLLQSVDHGLSMTAFADIEVEFGFHTATARLVTATGSFLAEFSDMSNPEHYGQPFFYAPSGDFTNVSIRTYLKDFRRNVWVIGDSYTSMYQARWTYQMIENMKIDSFLLDGLAGGASADMFPELQRMLALGTPKFLVWCLGMNDTVWQWMQYAKEVEMLCRERGITLIYQTIPLPTSGYVNKQRINEYIKASGYRYIDSCDAVVEDETTRAWYDGMLDDGVHPTALGAKALAGQVLVDFPEIMQVNP